MQDPARHVWLVLMKAFQVLMPHAVESIRRAGRPDFRVLGPCIKGRSRSSVGPKVWLTRIISVAVDRLVKKVGLNERAEDRRVRQLN